MGAAFSELLAACDGASCDGACRVLFNASYRSCLRGYQPFVVVDGMNNASIRAIVESCMPPLCSDDGGGDGCSQRIRNVPAVVQVYIPSQDMRTLRCTAPKRQQKSTHDDRIPVGNGHGQRTVPPVGSLGVFLLRGLVAFRHSRAYPFRRSALVGVLKCAAGTIGSRGPRSSSHSMWCTQTARSSVAGTSRGRYGALLGYSHGYSQCGTGCLLPDRVEWMVQEEYRACVEG